jgi:hypothetical protein
MSILTCLLQVRTSSVPRAARRRDWLRPLWLLGMLLYMCANLLIPFLGFLLTCWIRLSQLIGSTLALEYMRAGEFS